MNVGVAWGCAYWLPNSFPYNKTDSTRYGLFRFDGPWREWGYITFTRLGSTHIVFFPESRFDLYDAERKLPPIWSYLRSDELRQQDMPSWWIYGIAPGIREDARGIPFRTLRSIVVGYENPP